MFIVLISVFFQSYTGKMYAESKRCCNNTNVFPHYTLIMQHLGPASCNKQETCLLLITRINNSTNFGTNSSSPYLAILLSISLSLSLSYHPLLATNINLKFQVLALELTCLLDIASCTYLLFSTLIYIHHLSFY